MDCCDDLFAGVGVGGVGGMIVYRKSGGHCLAGRLVADGVLLCSRKRFNRRTSCCL